MLYDVIKTGSQYFCGKNVEAAKTFLHTISTHAGFLYTGYQCGTSRIFFEVNSGFIHVRKLKDEAVHWKVYYIKTFPIHSSFQGLPE